MNCIREIRFFTPLFLLAITPLAAYAADPVLRFEREKLSNEKFEAASACDVNRDGKMDIVNGGFWYAGPDFKTSHTICKVPAAGEYYDDFSDYPMDVNGDNYPDIITGGFFGGPLRWRQNPGGDATALWKEHAIARIGSIETTRFWDVDGDGHPEICPNASGNIIVFKLLRNAAGKGTGEFTSHTVKLHGIGHGLGYGDINMDGRADFVGPDGWYEAPPSPMEGPQWMEHKQFQLGSASVPILVNDVNHDGLNDLIVGHAHGYGLFWMQQSRPADGQTTWIKHMITEDVSQFHDVALHDIDKDGELELVTGKRWRAHNDKDPGAADPVGVYYYNINGGKFDRVTLDFGPADSHSGVGIYFWVEDVDANGWPDLIAPGKQGLYLFRNMGPK